jgi:hypothetical protein
MLEKYVFLDKIAFWNISISRRIDDAFLEHDMTWAVFPDEAHERALDELATTKSERVVAVVGGAMLERHVTRTLIERLRNEEPAERLLNVMNGTLGTIAPKIDLLYLLGSFDEATRKTMKGLACVRNVFAHHLDASFDHPSSELKGHLDRLTLHKGREYYPHRYGPDSNNAIEPIKSNRDLFLVNLKLALLFLMRDRCSHEMYTNKPYPEDQLREMYQAAREAEERRENQAGKAPDGLIIESTANATTLAPRSRAP